MSAESTKATHLRDLGGAPGKRADDPGKAWASNESIEATKPKARNEAVFNMNVSPFP
jgi:hypothetical protein